LRKLADQGQAILCTIHQPSSLLFESFDRLLLLEKGGETVYFGEIGQDSQVIRKYFGRHGAHCPSNVNPAEYMLEAIGAGVTPRVGNQDWKDTWLESPEFTKVTEEIATIKKVALLEEESDRTSMSLCKFLLRFPYCSDLSKMPLLSFINSRLWFNGTTQPCGGPQNTFSPGFSFQALSRFSFLCRFCNWEIV
jgi:ABC-2 type transporter